MAKEHKPSASSWAGNLKPLACQNQHHHSSIYWARELLCSTWAEALLRIGWVSLSREALKCIMHISHIAAKYIAWNWRRITKGPRSRSVASLPHLVLLAGPLKHLFGQRSNRLCRMQPHGPNDSLSIPARHFGDFDAQPLPGLTRMQHKAWLKEFPKSWATCKILFRSSFKKEIRCIVYYNMMQTEGQMLEATQWTNSLQIYRCWSFKGETYIRKTYDYTYNST